MWDIDFIILGEPASAKNQRRIVLYGDRPRLIKSKKALDYCDSFNSQCPTLEAIIETDCVLRIDVWYKSRRPDLSCTDLIMDLLQGKIYKNDRQVKGQMSLWNLDKKDPRCRVRVKTMEQDCSQGLSSFRQSEIWGDLD